MKASHMTHSRTQIPQGKMPDPPKGTQREYASKIGSNSKLKMGKAVKCSVTGIGKSTSTTTPVPCVQKTSPCEIADNAKEQQSTDDQPVHIPAVPVLQSLPPTGLRAINVTPPVCLATDTANVMTPSSNTAGPSIITDMTATQHYCISQSADQSSRDTTDPISTRLSAFTRLPMVSTHDPSTQLCGYTYYRYKNKFSSHFRTHSHDKTDELTLQTRECISQS